MRSGRVPVPQMELPSEQGDDSSEQNSAGTLVGATPHTRLTDYS